MKIAVLSGKGGAGKTLVSVNLACADKHSTYVDCDVEEPNGHLFLNPRNISSRTVCTMLPEFNKDRCTGCRKCVEFCRFNALMFLRGVPKLFPEVCHSCGGCQLVCPVNAVTEQAKPVGHLEIGVHRSVTAITGILNPGEASGIPVIQSALEQAFSLGQTVIIDCPPGSACSVMESITDADYCILVAEPTAFGLHNLKMVFELTQLLGKKTGIIINKLSSPYPPLEEFCNTHKLTVLARIPYQPEIAHTIAHGEILVEKFSQWNQVFSGILSKIGGDI